jgi:hypothetical protein
MCENRGKNGYIFTDVTDRKKGAVVCTKYVENNKPKYVTHINIHICPPAGFYFTYAASKINSAQRFILTVS